MQTKPDRYYWAWYECRMVIIKAALDNSGFFAMGQDALWGWSNAEIICEAEMPKRVEEEMQRCIVPDYYCKGCNMPPHNCLCSHDD